MRGDWRRILGIDPGSRVTGYGIIESNGMQSRHLASGCIRAEDQPWPQRLGVIFSGVAEVVRQYAPREVAVEQVFFARNAASALKLGQARGAAVCAAISCDIPVSDYSPRSIKQAIVGKGNADKAQVQHMVGILLGIRDPIQSDAADALAVALCHQHTSHTLSRMAMMRG